MGSNQGQQPHHADRGASVWSRDERRENRKVMRRARDAEAIDDSVLSNDEEPLRHVGSKARKRKSAKWCRRKEGVEHKPVLVREHNIFHWRLLVEYRCSVCGHKSYERKNP